MPQNPKIYVREIPKARNIPEVKDDCIGYYGNFIGIAVKGKEWIDLGDGGYMRRVLKADG